MPAAGVRQQPQHFAARGAALVALRRAWSDLRSGRAHVRTRIGEFSNRLAGMTWVSDLLVGGSLATGDYMLGVIDLDLVALADSPVDADRLSVITALDPELDQGPGAGIELGCIYVEASRLLDLDALHPTWTHGSLVHRALSRIARAELVRCGVTVFGRRPLDVLPPMSDDEVREAARVELTGYWAWAVRHPLMSLDPALADLSLTSMARGRHTERTGELLIKTRAVEEVDAPAWLIDQIRGWRHGQGVTSPRVRTAVIAWQDARRTVARARRTPR